MMKANAAKTRLVVKRLNHVQLSIPTGAEAQARAFYRDIIGLREISKPESLMSRGGLWFEIGDIELHLGVEPVVNPTKRHPAFEVEDVRTTRALFESSGVKIQEEPAIPGRERFTIWDPFGNRIEFLQFVDQD
jgi:catechol 2,3-dioxygenase-like lactoylglutathione lyase family enzyme